MTDTLPLRSGTEGEPVADLQRRLVASGHPTDPDPIGTFGPATAEAVRAFQSRRGLRCDGICGEETWGALVDAGHRLGDRLLYERLPMLRGDDVAELQRLLGALGFDAGRVDGFFGPDTTAAVVEFQRNVGLPTDGVCGPDTVEGLHRVIGPSGTGATIARLREDDALRHGPRGVAGRRIVVADGGEATGLADAVGRALHAAGAFVSVIHHPDEHERATAANTFGAEVFLGLTIQAGPGAQVAFYAREDFESVGGRRLAELLADALPAELHDAAEARGMRLPVLRDTKMPAVALELGPPATVVEHGPRIVEAVTSALLVWVDEPVL